MFHHSLNPSPGSPKWTGFKSPHNYEGKDTHGFYSWNMIPGQSWGINIWEFQCYDEGLLNGSNLCMDAHYELLAKEPANYQSEMYCTFSTNKNLFLGKEPTTTIITTETDALCPLGTHYKDETLGDGYQWWLCPNWAYLFGGTPPEICYGWLSLEKKFS